MSKWRKPLKNHRRFDARYFLNERVENEGIDQNSARQEDVKFNFNDFSFDSWLNESEKPKASTEEEEEEEEEEEYDELSLMGMQFGATEKQMAWGREGLEEEKVEEG